MKRGALHRQHFSSVVPAAPSNEETQTAAAQQALPECLAEWTGNLLYWVSGMGAQFYAATIAPLHLVPPQVAILQLLAAEGPLVQARLTDRTRIDKSTMVGLLNGLEDQGLIERRPARHDKRAFEVYLLTAGEERLREVEKLSLVADQQFFGILSSEEQTQFHAMLKRLATGNSRNMTAMNIPADAADKKKAGG